MCNNSAERLSSLSALQAPNTPSNSSGRFLSRCYYPHFTAGEIEAEITCFAQGHREISVRARVRLHSCCSGLGACSCFMIILELESVLSLLLRQLKQGVAVAFTVHYLSGFMTCLTQGLNENTKNGRVRKAALNIQALPRRHQCPCREWVTRPNLYCKIAGWMFPAEEVAVLGQAGSAAIWRAIL